MRIQEFYNELKRRKVFRVATVYAVTAWVTIQVINTVFPILQLPMWTVTLLTVLLIIGFPFALIFAWAFELTPDGIKTTPPREENQQADTEEADPSIQDDPADSESGSANQAFFSQSFKVLLTIIVLVSAVYIWHLAGEEPEVSREQRSIAVLPFETINGTSSSSITSGIQVGLMTRLSSISGLRVISRTSTLQYAGVVKPVAEIGQELNVEWIVRGEVQEANDQILVNARLIRASEDRQVWAKDYQRRLTSENIFDIQSELTREIAGELQTQISTVESDLIDRKPADNLQAYRDFSQGVSLLEQRTRTDILSSVEYLMSAIERDPGFAPAWAILAEALIYIKYYNYADIDNYSITAIEAIENALELNPNLAEAHASLGILRYTEKNGPEAIRSLRKAIELQPSFETAYNWLNFVYLLTGNPEESLKYAYETIELSPFAPAARLYPSLSYLANGQPAEALRQVNRAREIQPEWGEVYAIRGVIQYHNRQYENALESFLTADSLIA
ncbi:MAG: tetratricopeptide repeat protein, partial [Balneolaceae bacterium]|nr:tetratricopeptide repeat protein [Balneolaceae bacterium]